MRLSVIERQSDKLNKLSRLVNLPPGTVSADDARLMVTNVNGFLRVNEARLDLFKPSTVPIADWVPKTRLKAYSKLSKLYLDIETDGGIEISNSHRMPTAIEITGYRNGKYTEADFEHLQIFNPFKYSLKVIGLRNELGKNIYIRDRDEKQILESFLHILKCKKPEVLYTYNGHSFDIPFIVAKCMQHGIRSPFYISDHISTHRTAIFRGKPVQFHGIYLKYGNQKTHVIDVWQQVLTYDFVARNLNGYSLKNVPLEMGLRKEARLDLGFEGLLDCYARGEAGDESAWITVQEYLGYDLEDTELIADRLMPSIYYQQLFVTEFDLQTLATMGNATKWNSLLIHETGTKYDRDSNTGLDREGKILATSAKRKFKGGKTGGYAGIYKYVSKIDVASLYPSAMLALGLCSIKDVDRVSLAVLLYCKRVRIGFKTFKNLITADYTGDARTYAAPYKLEVSKCLQFCNLIGYDSDIISKLGITFNDFVDGNVQLEDLLNLLTKFGKDFFANEGVLKIFINSGYGFLASTGVIFNDPEAAALVTAYARKVLNFMLDYTRANGGIIGSLDTDGYYYTCNTFEDNKKLYDNLQIALPDWVNIEKETDAEWIFIPPVTTLDQYNKSYKAKSVNAKKLFDKTFMYEIEDDENDYTYWSQEQEEIDQAYAYFLSTYGEEKLNYRMFIDVAEKFDFVFPNNAGKRKNYVYKTGSKIKSKGVFNKRDKSKLHKTFQIQYLDRYMISEETAEGYVKDIIERLSDRTYDITELLVTRMISKSEKKLVEKGLGQAGDQISFYRGLDGSNKLYSDLLVAPYDYDSVHYITELRKLYSEIQTALLVSANEAKKTAIVPV